MTFEEHMAAMIRDPDVRAEYAARAEFAALGAPYDFVGDFVPAQAFTQNAMNPLYIQNQNAPVPFMNYF